MDSTDMTGIRIGKTDADSGLHTHFTVADSPGAAGDFVASLKSSDFSGYDPQANRKCFIEDGFAD